MAEGTREYKRLESMLKESDQKREKDLARVEGGLSRVEGRLDTALEELKSMMNGMTLQMNGMTLQHNEMRMQLGNRDREQGSNGGSILGNPMMNQGEGQSGGGYNHKYATKLDFPRFGGEGVDEWIFRVEQFFALDRIPEGSKIHVVSLHLDGGVLHWHKNLVKTKGRMPEWEEYKEAIRSRFGILAYHDPMAEMKKLKQTGTLQQYLMAFDALMDKAQLSEEQALSCFLAGLKHELEMVVRMFNPKKLQDAYSLARLQ